jgi:hypothetical protein
MLALTMGLLAWPLLQPLWTIKGGFLLLLNFSALASASIWGGLIYWKTTLDSETKVKNALLNVFQLAVGMCLGYLLFVPFEVIQILKQRAGAIPAALNRQRGTCTPFGGRKTILTTLIIKQ